MRWRACWPRRAISAFVLFYRLPGEGWAAGPNVALADAQRGDAGDPARRLEPPHRCPPHLRDGLFGRRPCLRRSPRALCRIRFSAHRRGRPPLRAARCGGADLSGRLHVGARRPCRIAPQSDRRRRRSALERAHSPHLHIAADAPPCFLLHAEDDASVPGQNSLLLREALARAACAVETHLFPDGGHGFGLRLARARSVEHWPDLFLAWGRSQRIWS